MPTLQLATTTMIRKSYIQTYKTIVKELALQFSKHYFDRSDIEILGDENVGIGPIDCNQYVFTIDNVICALHNDIPRRILLDRYEYTLATHHDERLTKMNLYRYYKKQG